ncbi:hypothetical protein HEK616_81050 (plasmid) [Streptomyces nigrescens]|uniref:SnoaL-like domain-containing protein n=1 Tax=Streptomyces nigrescens TaxID=1920 RepID=A0ABM8A7D0_STRNI|nr:hypothetical protein HEK616_81050 [Streptomyces nigrescens]
MFHLHSGQAPVRGRAAIREAVAQMFSLVPDLTFTFVSLRTGEDFWVVQWKLSGTSVSGAAVDVDLADFVLVDNGAVRESIPTWTGWRCRLPWRPPRRLARRTTETWHAKVAREGGPWGAVIRWWARVPQELPVRAPANRRRAGPRSTPRPRRALTTPVPAQSRPHRPPGPPTRDSEQTESSALPGWRALSIYLVLTRRRRICR